MLRVLLAVDHLDAVMPAERGEAGQRDLRCIGNSCEHRFAEDGPADADAVEAAGKTASDAELVGVLSGLMNEAVEQIKAGS